MRRCMASVVTLAVVGLLGFALVADVQASPGGHGQKKKATPKPKTSPAPPPGSTRPPTNQGGGNGSKITKPKPGNDRKVPDKPGKKGSPGKGDTGGDEFPGEIKKIGDILDREGKPKGKPLTSEERKKYHLGIKALERAIQRNNEALIALTKTKKSLVQSLWKWTEKRREARKKHDWDGVETADRAIKEFRDHMKGIRAPIESLEKENKAYGRALEKVRKLLGL